MEVKRMKKERLVSIGNCICALLLLVTLIMQFQPFWICTDCKTHKGVDKAVSIAEYIWIPQHHEPISDEMTDLYRETYGPDYKDPATGRKFKFKPNYILPSSLTVFLGSVVGIVVCVIWSKKFFLAGIPLIVGAAGIFGHLSYPALKVGQNSQTYLFLAIVVAAFSLITLVVGAIWAIQDKRKKHLTA